MIKSITLISQDFYPMRGGIANYLMNIYNKYFSNQRFQVIVPNEIGKKEDYQNLPFKVFRIDFAPFELNSKNRNKINQNMIGLLAQNKTDIVLFGYLRSHPEVGLLYKKYQARSRFGIFTHAKEVFIDNNLVYQNKKSNGSHRGYLKEEAKFYKRVLNQSDFLFCVSKYTKDLLLSQGVKKESYIIHPSVKIPTMNQFNKKIRKNNYNEFTILSVGRLIDRKGQDKVVDSISNLTNRIPSLRYLIVGNGPNKEKIKQKITDLNLENIVSLYEDIDDSLLSEFYRKSDLFVLPTNYIPPNDIEGFGIVFIEANLYGLPVIGGNTGGVCDAIINGLNGYLINPSSSQELEEKIMLLFSDTALRKKLGFHGQKRAITQFNNIPSDYLIKMFS